MRLRPAACVAHVLHLRAHTNCLQVAAGQASAQGGLTGPLAPRSLCCWLTCISAFEPLCRWLQLSGYMKGLGYEGVAQAKAAAGGSDFMLALFFRPVSWAWFATGLPWPCCRCAGRSCTLALHLPTCCQLKNLELLLWALPPLWLPRHTAASLAASPDKLPGATTHNSLQDKFELLWHEDRSRALLAALRCRVEGPALGQVCGLARPVLGLALVAGRLAACPLLRLALVAGRLAVWPLLCRLSL